MTEKISKWIKAIDRDSDGFTKMEGVLNKPVEDLSERFCAAPFDYVDIQSGGRLFLCCPTWLPTEIGNLSDMELIDGFNSETAQRIRASILEGSFKYCHKLACPYIQGGSLPKRTEIQDERHKRIVEQAQVSGLEPNHISLCYDDSCNLSCPSCRTNFISLKSGPEYDERRSLQKKVIRFAFGAPHDRALVITITGSGDPLGSKLFRDLLFSIDGSRYPNVRIDLHTNGVAFTAAAWGKLERIHKNIRKVIVSVDAGNEEQYRITRRGGNWGMLMKNLEMLGRKRQEATLRSLELNLIVQRDNFRGIPDYVRIGQRVGADCCSLSLLSDWGTWSKEELQARTVWSSDHPLFEEFLRVMADPILEAPIVYLGNTFAYRKEALAQLRASGQDQIKGQQESAQTRADQTL